MIKVVNIYKLDNLKLEDCVYIGRQNKKFNLSTNLLHNPYTLSEHNNDRELVINKYKKYLDKQLLTDNSISRYFNKLVELVKTKDIYLVCYCKPKDCHGDYIKELIETK